MVKNFLTEPVFCDTEIEALFDSVTLARAMLRVEGALARAQADMGMFPLETAQAITQTAETLTIAPEVLAAGVTNNGVPVPTLVKDLRAAVGGPHADWVHWGATSQDIVDNALSLCYRAALKVLGARLRDLLETLERQSTAHSKTIMAARTRNQLATPTTFGLRIAQWAQPLIACEADLEQVRARALRVQFGGASGNQTAVAPHGPDISGRLAEELQLAPGVPWHTDRSGLQGLAAWLVAVTTALGKIATDVVILSRSEIAEAFGGTEGGSSTMPHKSNPVTAEAMLSLARFAIACKLGLASAGIHTEERDGANWTVEWKLLPELLVTCGSALSLCLTLTKNLSANRETMVHRIENAPEMMAETAMFALSKRLGRQRAGKIVAEAILQSEPLSVALRKLEPSIDWAEVFDFGKVIASSRRLQRDIFSHRNT